MRPIRAFATAVAAVALLTASVVSSPAGAATDGVGTASTATKVVELAVGDQGSVLNLGLLADDARSTIDPAVASPEAFSRLLRVNINSPLQAVNDLVAALPAIEARQPGGDQVKEVPGVSTAVALPATPVSQAASLGSIQVDATKLTANLAAGVAQSGLSAGVTAATVGGGLVSVNGAKVNFSTSSAPASAEASRSVTLDNVTVLDLGAVLKGLGINLSDLPISSVSALLEELGLVDAVEAATGVNITTTLQDTVDTLNATIDELQVIVDSTVDGTLTQTIDDTLGLVGLDTTLNVSDTLTVAEADALIDDLQAELAGLLETSLVVLATSPLLQVGGVQLGLTSKAVSDVENSVASITGKIGSVKIGGIELLGGTDLLAATDRVSAIVTDANTKIAAALSAVSPELAGLVKVSVLTRDTSVTKSGDYVRSLAGITAASATITPPATLSQLVSSLTAPAADTIGDAIVAAGGTVTELEPLMAGLQSLLTLGAGVLASPSTLTVGRVLGAAEYKVAAAPVTPTGGELPRTGGSSLLLLGGGAAVLALAARRLLRSPGLLTTKR